MQALPRFYALFFRQLPSELTERNSTFAFASECDLKYMSKIRGIHSPYNVDPQTTYFRRFSTTS